MKQYIQVLFHTDYRVHVVTLRRLADGKERRRYYTRHRQAYRTARELEEKLLDQPEDFCNWVFKGF